MVNLFVHLILISLLLITLKSGISQSSTLWSSSFIISGGQPVLELIEELPQTEYQSYNGVPLFDWLAQRPKYFKNYVTKNPELFQDTPDLAVDFDSPIYLAYTTAKTVTIFKNVIPCFWQRYSWKLIWSDLNLMLLTKLILKSFKKKRKESSSCHALLCFGDRKSVV